MKKHVRLKIALAIIVFIAALITIMLYRYLHSSTIIIQVAPTNATVLINNKAYQNGIFKTSPKKQAVVTISAEGFKSQTINLDLQKDKTNKIFAELTPSDGDWNFYAKESNKNSLSILLSNNGYQPWDMEKIANNSTANNDVALDEFIKKVSIKAIMPLQFSVCGYPATRMNCDSISVDYDYNSECNDSLCLIISGRSTTLNTETTKIIQDNLEKYGYSLNQYQYTYQQNTN